MQDIMSVMWVLTSANMSHWTGLFDHVCGVGAFCSLRTSFGEWNSAISAT